MSEEGQGDRWMRAVVDGAELPIRDERESEWGIVLARHVDPTYVAVLWVYEDDEEPSGWYHDIVVHRRLGDHQLEHFSTGGSDWFGAPGTRPPERLWVSGLQSGGFGGPMFLTGAVSDLDYLRLLRHFATGEPIAQRDAPTGAFIARIE